MENKKKSRESTTNIFGIIIAAIAGVATGALGYMILNEKKESKAVQQKEKKMDEMETNDENEHYICPIGLTIMKDPVITPNGISFERVNIVNWLEKNNYCPITKKPLSVKDLIPNRSLKSAIDNYIKENIKN